MSNRNQQIKTIKMIVNTAYSSHGKKNMSFDTWHETNERERKRVHGMRHMEFRELQVRS